MPGRPGRTSLPGPPPPFDTLAGHPAHQPRVPQRLVFKTVIQKSEPQDRGPV